MSAQSPFSALRGLEAPERVTFQRFLFIPGSLISLCQIRVAMSISNVFASFLLLCYGNHLFKGAVPDSGKRFLIFELNCQSNYTPAFHAPEVTCWLAGVLHGSVRANLFVIYRARTVHKLFPFEAPWKKGLVRLEYIQSIISSLDVFFLTSLI